MPKGKLLEPSQSLFAELQSANTIQSCEVCKRVFSDGYELKDQSEKCHGNEYLSNHVYELQTTITEQREVLMKQIFQVKESESPKIDFSEDLANQMFLEAQELLQNSPWITNIDPSVDR